MSHIVLEKSYHFCNLQFPYCQQRTKWCYHLTEFLCELHDLPPYELWGLRTSSCKFIPDQFLGRSWRRQLAFTKRWILGIYLCPQNTGDAFCPNTFLWALFFWGELLQGLFRLRSPGRQWASPRHQVSRTPSFSHARVITSILPTSTSSHTPGPLMADSSLRQAPLNHLPQMLVCPTDPAL